MKAVILKKNIFSEGNEIITLFTREQGRVSGIARSVKSIKSKLAFGLQQLFYSEVELVKTRKNYSIIGVKQIQSFRHIRENAELINIALYATELVLKSTADEQPNTQLFDLYLAFLEHLDGSVGLNHPCKDFFSLKVMRINGYGIDFGHCAACGKPGQASAASATSAGLTAKFSNRKGGFLCPQCAARIPDATQLSAGLRELVATNYPLTFEAQDSIPENFTAELHRMAKAFSIYILERDLKAGRFLV